ncbi:bifunctional 3-(3-hydroxy-phenyl)propionate/3-hydroxycinnamic acid hydroxylase [Mycolicibacterium sp. CBM1]
MPAKVDGPFGDSDVDFDVAIVGMGPTGVTAANLLGQRGVATVVLERDVDTYPRQRAIAADEDALRVWQSLGLLDAIAEDLDQSVTVHYTDGQDVFFSFDLSAPGSQGLPGSAFFHQPKVESILRANLAAFPHVHTDCGQQVVGVEDTGEVVVLTVEDVATKQVRSVRARYVLACDGGSSPVRKMLGMSFAGRSLPEPWLDIQAKAIYERPTNGPVDFIFLASPERVGIDCQAPMGHHRWEFRLRADEDPAEVERPENIARLLAERGVDAKEIDILRHWIYTFHVRTATQWKKGRVLLCGDAAHIMPPFAGQGMSSGVRDAANVAWKLAEVVHGRAEPALLETYDTERRPHVEAMTRMTLTLGRLVNIRSRRLASARNKVLRTASRLPVLSGWLYNQRWKPQLRLTSGFLAARRGLRSPAGRPVWQPAVSTSDGAAQPMDDLLGHGFVVLGYDVRPDAVLSPEVTTAWRSLGAKFLTVRPAGLKLQRLADNEFRDDSGELERYFRRHDARIVIIRPDRIVFGCERDSLVPQHFSIADTRPHVEHVVLHDAGRERNAPLVASESP